MRRAAGQLTATVSGCVTKPRMRTVLRESLRRRKGTLVTTEHAVSKIELTDPPAPLPPSLLQKGTHSQTARDPGCIASDHMPALCRPYFI